MTGFILCQMMHQFVEDSSDDDSEGQDAPAPSFYESHSGGTVDVLNGTKDKAEGELKECLNIKGLDKQNLPRSGDIMVYKDTTLEQTKKSDAHIEVLDIPNREEKGCCRRWWQEEVNCTGLSQLRRGVCVDGVKMDDAILD